MIYELLASLHDAVMCQMVGRIVNASLHIWPRLISLSHESSHSFLFLSIIADSGNCSTRLAFVLVFLLLPKSCMRRIQRSENGTRRKKKFHMCHVELPRLFTIHTTHISVNQIRFLLMFLRELFRFAFHRQRH